MPKAVRADPRLKQILISRVPVAVDGTWGGRALPNFFWGGAEERGRAPKCDFRSLPERSAFPKKGDDWSPIVRDHGWDIWVGVEKPTGWSGAVGGWVPGDGIRRRFSAESGGGDAQQDSEDF